MFSEILDESMRVSKKAMAAEEFHGHVFQQSRVGLCGCQKISNGGGINNEQVLPGLVTGSVPV